MFGHTEKNTEDYTGRNKNTNRSINGFETDDFSVHDISMHRIDR